MTCPEDFLNISIASLETQLVEANETIASLKSTLREAWSVIRWQCFGECRTEGVDEVIHPAKMENRIRAALGEGR